MCQITLSIEQKLAISLTSETFMEKPMPSKSSFALVCGALVFIAFWGLALASVEIDPTKPGVGADGYGIYAAKDITLN